MVVWQGSVGNVDATMNEHLYTIPSGVIALALLVSMGLTKEIGYRAGLRKGRVGEKEAKDHIHAIQNSILGILALLPSWHGRAMHAQPGGPNEALLGY